MNGVINVLKPPAMTSSDVVSHLRRILHEKRIGHTGTLDPGAAGVLPVCVGRATKIADYIMHADKEYIAEICFGIETDTLDSYGAVVGRSDATVTEDTLLEVLPEFVGKRMQKPPMYSAIKHEGKKLYQLARQGITIEKPAREIKIDSIAVLWNTENRYLLRIRCSKGTYIRTLCHEIGKRLGVCAYTSFLMRTETCGYTVDAAHTFEEIENFTKNDRLDSILTPPEEALAFMPKVSCPDYLYDILTTGTPIDLAKADYLQIEDDTRYTVFCRNDFIGVGQRAEDSLKIVTMMKLRGGS
ncbi:MAG: tRNA pseudouridine(55) synthase TruB [Christensenella sp.]|nr:tRNA pseudouridine(55) synthase TruB [Christensenella sp.]